MSGEFKFCVRLFLFIFSAFPEKLKAVFEAWKLTSEFAHDALENYDKSPEEVAKKTKSKQISQAELKEIIQAGSNCEI